MTIGEAQLPEMRVKLELEPAKPMTMLANGAFMEMAPSAEQRYHVEVKPEDPRSNTRISYAAVRFHAVNHDTGYEIDLDLHPMWGSSGLHYGANSGLPDGIYTATVAVGVPTFARSPEDMARWRAPSMAEFEFRLEGGLLVSARVTAASEASVADGSPMPMPH